MSPISITIDWYILGGIAAIAGLYWQRKQFQLDFQTLREAIRSDTKEQIKETAPEMIFSNTSFEQKLNRTELVDKTFFVENNSANCTFEFSSELYSALTK